MKRKTALKKALVVITIMCLCLCLIPGCTSTQNTSSNDDTALSAEEMSALLEQAYVYTLPLMVMDSTFTSTTNTVDAGATKAPKNQFLHAQSLATAQFKTVVTPNVDTIYSQAFLDLSKDAVILTFPQTDRFYTVEVIDAYSNSIAILDAAQFEQESQSFIFTLEDFDQEIPDGMNQIVCPTPMMWIIVRTLCYDVDDEANVHAIQDKMDAYTYTQYKDGTTAEKPQGTYSEENDFVPIEHVMSLDIEEYFTRANELMAQNNPAAADESLMEQLAQINVGAGLSFDASLFGDSGQEMYAQLQEQITAITGAQSKEFVEENGNWSYPGAPIAEFGTEYYYRAYIALVGFGANPVSVAVYPMTTQDSSNQRLNGENIYTVHFDADQIPTVKEHGFWSLTAYNSSDNFLIDNELDRYCINDRSTVSYNDDGSLDITLSTESPSEGTSNWLPVCEGDFHLVLRVYFPTDNIVDNNWTLPSVEKAA